MNRLLFRVFMRPLFKAREGCTVSLHTIVCVFSRINNRSLCFSQREEEKVKKNRKNNVSS